MIHPKDYLSYSQWKMWKRSPEKYMDQYWRGKPGYTNRAMDYGKRLADAIENDEETGDFELDLIKAQLPKLEVAELELRCELRVDKEVVPLMGKMDHAKRDLSAFREYKTGRTKWNQSMVDRDEQLTWYATQIYIITKKIVGDIELCHAPTEIINGKIQCTGEVRVYKTTRRFAQILNMMLEMRKAWREIGERCEAEII